MRALLTANDAGTDETCSSRRQPWGVDSALRARTEHALRQAEDKYWTLFEDAVVGIFQTTPEGRPLTINRTLAQIYGYSCAEQLLAEVSNVVDEVFVDPKRMDELRQILDEIGAVRGAEVEVYCRDRSKKWVLANLRAVRDADGIVVLHEGTVEDITERKLAEKRVQFLAYHDALTELPNRILFHDRLTKALASARRRKENAALLFLDLDRFKLINDTYGHSIGNLLLRQVADRLRGGAREQDTVARIGGDEFVILLPCLSNAAGAAVAAERVVKAMAAPFVVEQHLLKVSCSVGISIFPDHGTDGETLIKNADTAMYCAKENGCNAFRFFGLDANT